MGRSRKSVRRRTTVKVKRKSKKRQNKAIATLPKELKAGQMLVDASIPGTARKQTTWSTDRTLKRNYRDNQVMGDANAIGMDVDVDGDGAAPIKEAGASNPKAQVAIPDDIADEVRATLGHQRLSGKRPPKKLTTVQIKVIGALLDKHGDDIASMVTDTKLNRMQHSQGVLKKMIASYRAYPNLATEGGHRGFHSTQKPS